MCGPILAAIILVPAIEIYTLFKVGGVLGFFPTMLIIVATAVFGLAAVRGQGFATLERLRSGQAPIRAEVLEGPLLIGAAALLLFPGLITDVGGVLLLVPPIRRAVARRLSRRFRDPKDPTVIVIER